MGAGLVDKRRKKEEEKYHRLKRSEPNREFATGAVLSQFSPVLARYRQSVLAPNWNDNDFPLLDIK